jgi:ribosomal protein S12 methylthiotransferase accessory factor
VENINELHSTSAATDNSAHVICALFGILMEIKVNFLDKLRLEAKFDDFTVISDQPIRYKGDGSAPGPFDYFLASSALCAAYFVKLYCNTRNISTENIRLSQNNIVDPENRYAQIFKIQVELPADISESCRKAPNSSLKKSRIWMPMRSRC